MRPQGSRQMLRYHHTQVGYVTIIALFIPLVVLMYFSSSAAFNWISLPVVLRIAICIAVFGALTVSVDQESLRFHMGIGLVRRRFALQDILKAERFKYPFWYGWGIRYTPRGWLYNTSGLEAVEVTLRNGKHTLIGTDDPEGLLAVLGKPGVNSGQ